MNTDEQDSRDMARLAAGQDGALNDLMGRHATRLYHYLLRSLQDESDASDLAQETFARVYLNRSRFRPGQRFQTWLYAIASNLVRDRYRWRARHPLLSLDSDHSDVAGSIRETASAPEASPDESLQIRERSEAVRKAIARLPEDLRQPLILSLYEDLPHAEIAEILNCSPKAVETRLYRARHQLRASLAELVT